MRTCIKPMWNILIINCITNSCRSQWPRGLRRRSAVSRLLRLWVRIPPWALMSVCCECCVLSGRGLCNALIKRPKESYRLWCVVVCDLETSRMRRPWPALARSATGRGGGRITNSCIWNTCVTWQGIDYKLPEDEKTILSKRVRRAIICEIIVHLLVTVQNVQNDIKTKSTKRPQKPGNTTAGILNINMQFYSRLRKIRGQHVRCILVYTQRKEVPNAAIFASAILPWGGNTKSTELARLSAYTVDCAKWMHGLK